MRQLLGMLFLFGALSFVACQQTQEADEDGDGTTVIEDETVVPADEPDVDMDVQMEDGGGVQGEVEVDEGGARGEVEVEGGNP